MQVAFVALDSAPYRIGVAVSQWQKHDLFHLINPIGVVDTYDTPNASVSVFSAMSADALKMLSSQKRLFGNSGWMRTPLKKCSLTADDGASSPVEWCTHFGEMVHGGRGRGAPGHHAGNYSGMPLRLRMDSPSIWMV